MRLRRDVSDRTRIVVDRRTGQRNGALGEDAEFILVDVRILNRYVAAVRYDTDGVLRNTSVRRGNSAVTRLDADSVTSDRRDLGSVVGYGSFDGYGTVHRVDAGADIIRDHRIIINGNIAVARENAVSWHICAYW